MHELLRDKVRAILLRDWDPIGVADQAPRDEYDAYIAPIADMLSHDRSASDIAHHLMTIETDLMGLPANADRAGSVARKLRELTGGR